MALSCADTSQWDVILIENRRILSMQLGSGSEALLIAVLNTEAIIYLKSMLLENVEALKTQTKTYEYTIRF